MADKLTRTGRAFAVLMALTPAAGVAGGMAMAPLQGLAGLAGARGVTATARLAWPFLLFALWAATSSMWSPMARPDQALKVLGAIVTGALLVGAVSQANAADRRLAGAATAAAVLILALYCAVEAGFDMPLNRLDEPGTERGILERNPGKGVSILVALLWPAAMFALTLARPWRFVLLAALVGLAAPLTLQFNLAANAAGLLAGVVGCALAWAAPRVAPLAASALAALWLLLAPFLTPLLPKVEALPLSWRMRGEIWDFAIARIQEKPWFGWGLDGARAFGETLLSLDGLPFRAIPLHPHSFSIHVWLETGAVGALLLAFAMVWTGRAAARQIASDRRAAAALCGAIFTLGAIWNVSYGAWQEWWMATAFVALAAAMAVRR
jgi:O-antigen ligase